MVSNWKIAHKLVNKAKYKILDLKHDNILYFINSQFIIIRSYPADMWILLSQEENVDKEDNYPYDDCINKKIMGIVAIVFNSKIRISGLTEVRQIKLHLAIHLTLLKKMK